MRVGILALLQESNTFLRGATTLDDFERDLLAEGDEVRTRLFGAHHEVDGFFRGLEAAGVEAVPVFAARAFPFGVMTAETFATLLARIDAALERAGPLDGLLVAPHGATVADGTPDVDGCWVGRLRARFGPRFPIIGTLDLHANVSPALVGACNALIAYRTNPHLDQRARGEDAARLMARTLRGEITPTMAAEFLPLAVNIERQATAEEPCRSLYERADAQLASVVLSNSIVLGFPYADVPHMGATVLVVTDNDPAEARQRAAESAGAWWARRAEFVGALIGVDEAVARAESLDGPVCLLDMGDNVGGGSPGDGTVLAHALHRRRLGPSFVCLFDPEAVDQWEGREVGARLRLQVGGKTDDRQGPPLDAEWTLRGRSDGRFRESEARHGGISAFDQGPTAIVESDAGLTLMLTSRRMVPFSLNQLTSCGLDPARFRVLVAKGVHAPSAAYGPVCRNLVRVNTPGVTTADLKQLDYQYRRRPMYPFEAATDWAPAGRVERRS